MQPSIPNIWGLDTTPIKPPPVSTPPSQKSVDMNALLEFILGPSAIRGYGTALGAAAGSMAGQPYLGGVAGNALTNLAQSYAPNILGQASESPVTTALVDSAANLLGGKVAEGALKLGRPLQILGNKVLGRDDSSFIAEIASRFGTKPSERKVVSALNPRYNSNLSSSVESLVDQGAPLSLGEITGKEGTKEFGLLAEKASERIPKQNVWLMDKARDLLSLGKGSPVQQENLTRWGMDNTVDWVINSHPRLRMMPDADRLVRSAATDIDSFKQLAGIAGPEKSHMIAFKGAMENALDEGLFDGGKLFSYFTQHRDLFNLDAALLELKGVAKATDLKSSWNEFIHANALMQSGRAVSRKGMEMALTNAGIVAAVGFPILGAGSYPAWRAIAGAGRILLVGPALGKAFANPKVVRQFTKLTTNSASNPANASTVKNIIKWAWKNGVAWKSVEGADFMINPNDPSKPYPVDPNMPMPEMIIPDNLWK